MPFTELGKWPKFMMSSKKQQGVEGKSGVNVSVVLAKPVCELQAFSHPFMVLKERWLFRFYGNSFVCFLLFLVPLFGIPN